MAEPRRWTIGDTRLSLLQGFELEHDGLIVRVPLSAQRVAAFLAIHRRRLLRPYVAGVLWTDHTQESANASLRTALWRLRQPFRLIEASATHIALAPAVAVDLQRVSRIASEATAGNADNAQV